MIDKNTGENKQGITDEHFEVYRVIDRFLRKNFHNSYLPIYELVDEIIKITNRKEQTK